MGWLVGLGIAKVRLLGRLAAGESAFSLLAGGCPRISGSEGSLLLVLIGEGGMCLVVLLLESPRPFAFVTSLETLIVNFGRVGKLGSTLGTGSSSSFITSCNKNHYVTFASLLYRITLTIQVFPISCWASISL